MVKYESTLYPVDLRNTPKLIYEMGLKFREEVLDDESAKTDRSLFRISSNPPLVCKKFYFDFLTGSRCGESLLLPYPKIRLSQMPIRDKNLDMMRVEKVNEKHWAESVYLPEEAAAISAPVGGHFKPRRKHDISLSKRKVMVQTLPIDNEWEALMWKYVAGRERSELLALETVVDFSYFGTYKEARSPLSKYMKYHFKTDLTNGEVVFKDNGLSPHVLRHLRAYNLLLEKGWSDTLVMTYMGWDKREMTEHYVYINKMITEEQQTELLRKQITLPSGQFPRYGIPMQKNVTPAVLPAVPADPIVVA